MVPLLQLISRGSPMSYEDSNRIIPLFYLFSSLFSHSLISVHDSEFFGHEMEGTRLLFFPNVPCMCPQLDLLLSKTFFGWLLDIILCLIGAGYPVDTLICHLPFPSFGGLSKIMYCLLFSAVTLHLAATET